MKKYIPGTLAIALAYLFLILAFTIGIKALVSLPVIVYAQYRLLRRAKKQPLPKQGLSQRRAAVK